MVGDPGGVWQEPAAPGAVVSPLASAVLGSRGQEQARRVHILPVATLASLLAAAAWTVAAVVTAHRGLDFSDESFYLLSYRWWDSDIRTFSGAQYVYGPIFELLGYDIAGLRLVRLLTVVGANALFGWTFMRWLRLHRDGAPASRWWEAAGTAAILACGGMSYAWLPLSPGYNDISLLGSLIGATVVLRMAADVRRRREIPFWVPMSLGPLACAMLMAKWASSSLTLVIVAAAAIAVLGPAGVHQTARVAAWALVGFVLSAVAVHALIIPLDVALPAMLATNQLVAAGANHPLSLGQQYLDNLSDLISRTATHHGPLLATAAAAATLRSKTTSWVLAIVALTTAALSLWILLATGAFTGGSHNIPAYSVGLTLVLAIPVIVALGRRFGPRRIRAHPSSWRKGLPGAAVALLLLALPFSQAAGTGNPFYFLSFNALSAWVALSILTLTGIEGAPVVARALTVSAVAGAVVFAAVISTSALLFHPYRTSPPNGSTVLASGVPALSSIRLAPETATAVSRLRQTLDPYLVAGGGTYMMAFDESPGVIYALDGRSVGEAWYSRLDRPRTAAGIRASCPDGTGPWGERPPILFFNRAVSASEIAALKACGLDFALDYRQVEDPGHNLGYAIYVGATESAVHADGAP